MAHKWYDIAVKSLDQGDEISKSYSLKLNDKEGYLLFSSKKVLFVHGEGLLRKKYELTLNCLMKKSKAFPKQARMN